MTNKIAPQSVSRAAELFASAERIVLFTHMAPDGDAMGSTLALYHHLVSSAHSSVTPIVPNAFPDFLAWLPGAEQMLVFEKEAERSADVIRHADLIVCLDFNEPKRIGPAGELLLQNPCPKVLIDHHIMADKEWLREGDVVISHPESPSASELVFRLLWQTQNFQLSTDIATCIYTGMMTDTGNFSFNSNYPEMYEIIMHLVEAGIDKDAIYNSVFNQYSADRMRLMGYCLHQKMRIFPECHLALIALSSAELKQFHFRQGDAEGLVNLPLQIADVYYSVFMREQDPKPGTPKPVVKISFRSQGDRPVNIFAREIFNGGGHMNASGGEYVGSIHGAVSRFLASYSKYLKED